jgi:hypothetical protein
MSQLLLFFCSVAKEVFQTQLFKTQVLTQPDFENQQNIQFKCGKGHFWITSKGPVCTMKYWASFI